MGFADYLPINRLIPTFDGKQYIYKTCHAKLLKGQLPCQAVINNLLIKPLLNLPH
jgi:hypothetical protein